ncbi:MAG: hypothetical protein COW24_03345 [Candidatus Kerfeldbacteria bacterium CG15_BIG_FIL_POST_REV_8_21_14_020_45_12]|uniref:Uncharacterized protein n=1 Tax=Candidatus Kerfeldbacteria bacterium CG15_BIG_FIL_POST_REV_8_21_14_020_45_12 TaxID=2014247 RepID=A0A2M7H3P4_9BACT|nr:MAG: hypothetical protein COW24_03345 [Candidatus Kerfeldbacteria bacterium CG15_BIG_FIL_POST_REV_8_21_14_020_45_12]PJA93467.1 MAG: hypothetical protein CO132_03150 [Candidatus Kerfeldbacteria bacterium CG_4_9_14_3_um_filter_45_8]
MRQSSDNVALTFGDRLRNGKLTAWHLGLMLAGYNACLTLALAILSLASVTLFPLWAYLLICSPVLFCIFWLWFSQNLLSFYKSFNLHDTLMIAKISVLPFVILLLISAVGVTAELASTVARSQLGTVLYYTLMYSVGSTFLGLTVIVFGLRHRIRISAISLPKRQKK